MPKKSKKIKITEIKKDIKINEIKPVSLESEIEQSDSQQFSEFVLGNSSGFRESAPETPIEQQTQEIPQRENNQKSRQTPNRELTGEELYRIGRNLGSNEERRYTSSTSQNDSTGLIVRPQLSSKSLSTSNESFSSRQEDILKRELDRNSQYSSEVEKFSDKKSKKEYYV